MMQGAEWMLHCGSGRFPEWVEGDWMNERDCITMDNVYLGLDVQF